VKVDQKRIGDERTRAGAGAHRRRGVLDLTPAATSIACPPSSHRNVQSRRARTVQIRRLAEISCQFVIVMNARRVP
jgi:hypothetical protein